MTNLLGCLPWTALYSVPRLQSVCKVHDKRTVCFIALAALLDSCLKKTSLWSPKLQEVTHLKNNQEPGGDWGGGVLLISSLLTCISRAAVLMCLIHCVKISVKQLFISGLEGWGGGQTHRVQTSLRGLCVRVCACVCASRRALLASLLLPHTLTHTLLSNSLRLLLSRWCLGFSWPTWVLWVTQWIKYTLLAAWQRKQRYFTTAGVMRAAFLTHSSSLCELLYKHQKPPRSGLHSAGGTGMTFCLCSCTVSLIL